MSDGSDDQRNEKKDIREICLHAKKIKECQRSYRSNKVITSKYKWWNFVPKNLMLQFKKLANIYFNIICFMQIQPSITISAS